jgi:hypothetical protein
LPDQASAITANAPVDAQIPSQLADDGLWLSNLMAIKAEIAGAEAIKIPTLLNSKLLIASEHQRK